MTTSRLSARSVRYLHAILRSALSRAVNWGKAGRNAARVVSPPRAQQEERVPPTQDQARPLLEAVKGDRWEALFTVTLGPELRQGEPSTRAGLTTTWSVRASGAGILSSRFTASSSWWSPRRPGAGVPWTCHRRGRRRAEPANWRSGSPREPRGRAGISSSAGTLGSSCMGSGCQALPRGSATRWATAPALS
jgi:hypothetical protein